MSPSIRSQLQWDQISDKPFGGIQRDILQSQMAQAVMAAQIAELQYDNVKRGGTDAQKAAARAQVAQAQAQLQKLLGDDRTRALADAQVKQAELNLEAAKQRLKDAVLTSPITGHGLRVERQGRRASRRGRTASGGRGG